MTTRAVGLRRLLKLADFLETLRNWVGDDWKGKADLSCGTTARALSWATTIPSLRRAGLRLNVDSGLVENRRSGDRDPISAAMTIFELTIDEASEIFYPSSDIEIYATPKYVADKIRRFVTRAKAHDE